MKNWYTNLSLGSKILMSIGSLLIIVFFLLSLIIISRASHIQHNEASKLITNVTKQQAAVIQSYLNEVYVSLRQSKYTIEKAHNENTLNNNLLDSVLIGMLDSNHYGIYGYINYGNEYLKMVKDDKPEEDGGITFIPMDKDILSQGSIAETITKAKTTLGNPSEFVMFGKSLGVGMFLNMPIVDTNNNTIGSIGIFVNIKLLSDIILDKDFKVFGTDYVMLLTNDGTLAVHPNYNYIGKRLIDINKDETVTVLSKAVEDGSKDIYDYRNVNGDMSLTGTYPFEIGHGTNIYWTVILVAPTDGVYEPIYHMRNTILVSIIIAITILLGAMFLYIRTRVARRINNVYTHLTKFFKYINHETKEVPDPLRPTANDELGNMARMLNENIENTKLSLEQDASAIKNTMEVTHKIKNGDLTNRITIDPKTPQLKAVSYTHLTLPTNSLV